MIFISTAWAQEAAQVPEFDFTGLFIKMLVLLAVIVVLAFVIIRFVGHGGRLKNRGGAQHFELISWHRLDQKKTLYVVRIGKRHFALGGTDASLNLLTELDESELDNA